MRREINVCCDLGVFSWRQTAWSTAAAPCSGRGLHHGHVHIDRVPTHHRSDDCGNDRRFERDFIHSAHINQERAEIVMYIKKDKVWKNVQIYVTITIIKRVDHQTGYWGWERIMSQGETLEMPISENDTLSECISNWLQLPRKTTEIGWDVWVVGWSVLKALGVRYTLEVARHSRTPHIRQTALFIFSSIFGSSGCVW
jgi:hypothetical protein